MNNARFSSLIYRIIGKPERWHDDYIDDMHQILDETESFDEPYNFSELEVGDQIISRLKQNNEALIAFNTLLDQSRFKMIILDDQLKPIYHTQSAVDLRTHLLSPSNDNKIAPGLYRLIRKTPNIIDFKRNNALVALDYYDENGDQIYHRSIQNQAAHQPDSPRFHLLLVLDRSHAQNNLNADLIAKYQLTEKEHMVLLGLVHGKGIKQIAEESFISDNTVKTHLKSIFRKTDTNSQTAVVRLILTHESRIFDSYFAADISNSLMFHASANDQELTLASGHKIAYCEYGPKQGRPLLVFHGSYSCRLSVPPAVEEICQRTNRRIIIPDRPGIGKTPYIKDHPAGWNNRLQEFIDLLGLDQYDILGSVLGCPLAVSFAMQADNRLQKVILNSPVVVNQKSHTEYLTGILSPTARLVRASKRFARELYELWLKSVTLNLGAHFRDMLESLIGSAERDQFKADGTFETMIDAFKEGTRNSLEGIANEMVFCLTPLNLDFKKLTVPVEIWYGTEEKYISLEGVKQIFKDLPAQRLHVREGHSTLIYYALFEEMIV